MELIDYSFCSKPFIYTIVSWLAFFIIRLFKYKLRFVGIFRKPTNIQFHTLDIAVDKEVTVKFLSSDSSNVNLITKLGKAIPEYVPCDIIDDASTLSMYWQNHAKLIIKHRLSGEYDVYEFDWMAIDQSKLEDHVMMAEGGHWYGSGHVFLQPWPLEKWYYNLGAFITKESFPFKSNYGELLEKSWISSSGVALHVDFDVPLFVSTNFDYDRTIRLVSSYHSPYRNVSSAAAAATGSGSDVGNVKKNRTFLKYTIIQTGGDARDAFFALREEKLILLPTAVPDESMFRRPIWSTWAQHKKNITQDKVLEFAAEIRSNGFGAAQLEIDDDWTPHYGDWEFDRKKFPCPKVMVDTLKEMGYRVMLWVHPFASPQSKSFWEGLKIDKHVWVTWRHLGIPALVSWWNGYGALLDVTNPVAVRWFTNKLRELIDKYGITSFKMDAGEAARISTFMTTKVPMENPNSYTKRFAELTHSLDETNRAQELRVGAGSQHLPLFYRLQDKDSNWGNFNGIKTVIPHVLTQGLLGYPFVLPDMIGGNAYSLFWGSSYPEKELFIRWVQVNAFLPSMQFSIVPWQYDYETVSICRKMCDLHQIYADKIINLAKEATQTGAPIVRPLWWIARTDEVALTISTEFLLGDDLLVAPVLDSGARSRDVYLPSGTWRDGISKNQLEGGRWYRCYPAELDQLPYFLKI